jgi:hypothetical protein
VTVTNKGTKKSPQATMSSTECVAIDKGLAGMKKTFGDGRNATWHWVNILTLGFTIDGDGGPSSFSDAVKWSREDAAAEAACATSISPADSDMTQQRDKRAALLRYRARELILWDLHFENHPRNVRKMNLGWRGASLMCAFAQPPVTVPYPSKSFDVCAGISCRG